MSNEVIEVDGKLYTHRSGIPTEEDICLRQVGSWEELPGTFQLKDWPGANKSVVRVILTPYVEPGPWDNKDNTWYNRLPIRKSVSQTGLPGIFIGGHFMFGPMYEKFLLDAVKQAKSMGVINDYSM